MISLTKQAALVCKRVFDTTVSANALLALSPVIALIALGIKLDDGGSVFLSRIALAEGGIFAVLSSARFLLVDPAISDTHGCRFHCRRREIRPGETRAIPRPHRVEGS